MLLLITEKHSPEEIINYFSKFGRVRMIIRAGKYCLQYENPNHQQLVLKNRNVEINGKQIKIQQQGQIQIEQQPQQIDSEIMEIKNIKAAKLIRIIQQCKEQTINALQKLFKKTAQEMQTKVQNIEKEYKDQVLNKSQIQALQDLLKPKCKDFTNKCTNHLKQIKNTIRQFSKNNPKVYDIEPEVNVATDFTTKKINHENPKIDQGLEFTNPENQSVKRIIASNANSFIVTQRTQNSLEGQLKFYSCKEIAALNNISYPQAAPYGITILNNDLVVIGHVNGQISAHCTNTDRQLSCDKPFKTHNDTIFDVKNFRFKENYILTGSYDKTIKIHEIIDQPITDTIFEIQLQQKYSGDYDSFQAFQQWDQQFISLGCLDKLIFSSINKKKKIAIPCASNIYRIKKFNQNLIVTGLEDGRVQLIDTRNNSIVTNFSTNTKVIRAIEIIPENTIFYGGKDTVGIVDIRNVSHIIWTNMNRHRDYVQDITRLQSSVISGDRSGIICQWTL